MSTLRAADRSQMVRVPSYWLFRGHPVSVSKLCCFSSGSVFLSRSLFLSRSPKFLFLSISLCREFNVWVALKVSWNLCIPAGDRWRPAAEERVCAVPCTDAPLRSWAPRSPGGVQIQIAQKQVLVTPLTRDLLRIPSLPTDFLNPQSGPGSFLPRPSP